MFLCDKPGCGRLMIDTGYRSIHDGNCIYECSATPEEHRLCARVHELEAKLAEEIKHHANFKAAYEHQCRQFQQETLRTSEQYQMLVKWMKRNADKGCSAEPWAKDDCPDCTLMRETKELLERPINVAKPEVPHA